MLDFAERMIKENFIERFRHKKTKHKAYRLFEWYGIDLPPDAIEYLQEQVKSLADDIEINGKAESFNVDDDDPYIEGIFSCHTDIYLGEPKMKSYEYYAKQMNVATQTFIKHYKKIFPT